MIFYPPQGKKADAEALGGSLRPGFFAPQAPWPTYSGTATLPASAFAAYDPAESSNVVLGACVFNGSSQYASTSSVPTSELGNGTAYVVGARFYVNGAANATYPLAFGSSGGTTPYFAFDVNTNTGDIEVIRHDGVSADALRVESAAPDGWSSMACRINADGTIDVAWLASDDTEVVWKSDATVKAITGFDRFAIGALVRNTVAGYFEDAIADCYFGSSSTALEDAAMEAFCLGASPASAEVDAANHWLGAEDWDDAIGSITLTESGSPTFSGTSVCVNRDITALNTVDRSHYTYGGAEFDGGDNVQNTSWTTPAADYYMAMYVNLPDATPTAQANLWTESANDGGNNVRRIYLNTAGEVKIDDRAGGVSDATQVASLSGGAGVNHLVVAKFSATGAGRTIWAGPVGGTLSTAADASTSLPTGLGELYIGAGFNGTSNRVESGTVISRPRIFLASDVSDETAFLNALLDGDPTGITPVHEWTLVDAAGLNDSGSGTAANLSWSSGGAYADPSVFVAGRPDSATTITNADHYAASVKGGAQTDGTSDLKASSGISLAAGSGFIVDGFFDLPAWPVATQEAVVSIGDSSGHYCEIALHPSAFDLRGFLTGDTTLYTQDLSLPATGAGRYYFAMRVSDGGAVSVWGGQVGGALGSAGPTTGQTYTTFTKIAVMARSPGGGTNMANGSVASDVRITMLSAIADVDEFVRARHRNWVTGVTSAHAWKLDGDTLDSAGSADLAWTGTSAYADDLVVSSHHHLLAVGSGVTYVGGEIDASGSNSGYARIANGMPIYTDDFAAAFRAEPDGTSAGWLFETSNGSLLEQIYARHTTFQAQHGYDGRTPSTGSGLATDTPSTTMVWKDSADVDSEVGVSVDDTETTNSVLTADPVTSEATMFARPDGTSLYNGTMTRAAFLADASERADARSWVEA